MEKVNTTTKQRNILFVDSDKELIRYLKDYLENHEIKEKYNLNFYFAGSSKEAFKKLAELKIDLILLEILLPVVNGYYFLNALKKQEEKIPVIVYTKLKGPQDMAKLAASEVENIFLKQMTKIEDIVQMIAKEDKLKANLDKVVAELQSEIKTLADSESQVKMKVVQCPRCGMILNRESHFCNNCGQQIFQKSKGLKVKAAPSSEGNAEKPTEQENKHAETPPKQGAQQKEAVAAKSASQAEKQK